MVDNTNLVVAAYNYQPFGGMIDNNASEPLSYKYTGHEYDEETGLHNFRARLYDEDLGRFYGVDPQGQFASPYTGMGNNPVMMVDPDGEFVITAILIGAAISGTLYTGGKLVKDGNLKNWDLGEFGMSLAIGGISGLAGAGAGALWNSVSGSIYGAVPGALVKGSIYAASGGISGGLGNVIMTGGEQGAFWDGFKQGAATGAIMGGITGGIEGFQNAQSVGANPWTGKLYQNQTTYSAPSLKQGIPLQVNPEEGCYGDCLAYADDGHGNRNSNFFKQLTGNSPGADVEQVANRAGIPINEAGRVTTGAQWDRLGRRLTQGNETMGAISGAKNHWVNITRITTADKWRIIGGGWNRVLRSTSIWDPLIGHTSGTANYLKVISAY